MENLNETQKCFQAFQDKSFPLPAMEVWEISQSKDSDMWWWQSMHSILWSHLVARGTAEEASQSAQTAICPEVSLSQLKTQSGNEIQSCQKL